MIDITFAAHSYRNFHKNAEIFELQRKDAQRCTRYVHIISKHREIKYIHIQASMCT